jgi:hypothetical protein
MRNDHGGSFLAAQGPVEKPARLFPVGARATRLGGE